MSHKKEEKHFLAEAQACLLVSDRRDAEDSINIRWWVVSSEAQRQGSSTPPQAHGVSRGFVRSTPQEAGNQPLQGIEGLRLGSSL